MFRSLFCWQLDVLRLVDAEKVEKRRKIRGSREGNLYTQFSWLTHFRTNR